ncbi:MAG: hypothetical protein J1F36_06965 [Clostridiales bacterium]|nr:hypothetical protein [Clostridiales bacterium]
MEKSKLAIAADEILRAATIWLLSAICLRYLIKELYLIILIATSITMLATLLIRHYYSKKNMTAKNIKQTDDAMRELLVSDRSALLDKLSNALGGYVASNAVISQNTVIYPYFYGKLPLDKLNLAYNAALGNNKKLIILCAETSAEVEKNLDLFSDIPVAILRKNQAYAFLQKYGLLPETKVRPKKKLHFLKNALKKSKIKGYLSAALILLVTAAFSPYALLCIIAAAVNITMSILCEVKGN